MSLSFELAWAILLRKKRHTFRESPLFAAFIGITLSIVPLVLVLEVSDGMISGIMNRYIETFYSHIMLDFYRQPDPSQRLVAKLERQIKSLGEVRAVYRERKGAALLIANRARTAVQVRALEPEAFESDQGLRKYLKLATASQTALKSAPYSLPIFGAPGEIWLASDVAFKLQVQVGDEVALLTGAHFGKNLRPKVQRFTVRAIVGTGYQELDRLWVFVSYEDGRKFFHNTNSQLLLHVKIANAFDLPQLKQVSRQVKSQAQMFAGGAQVRTWYNQAADLQQSYQFTKSILVYIMYLIVAVGTINIASSMVLLVLQNSEEIAIMKALGATKSLVGNTYIWVALLVSLLAIACGTLLGALLSYFINEIIATINWLLGLLRAVPQLLGNFSSGRTTLGSPIPAQVEDLLNKSYYLEHIPIEIEPLPLLAMAGFVLLITFLCSIIPALKAARMYPLAILRQNRS